MGDVQIACIILTGQKLHNTPQAFLLCWPCTKVVHPLALLKKSSNLEISNLMATTNSIKCSANSGHASTKTTTTLSTAMILKAFIVLVCLAFFLLVVLDDVAEAKVVDFGSKLPDFIDEHSDKSWLIKFYAPWCYHCQQLEPTYINVAAKIYRNHDRLIVGRVDCTKYGSICEKYGVQSYPTLIYLTKNSRVVYKEDRSFESMIDFVARLEGPDFKIVNDCDQLKRATDLHGLVVLSVTANNSSNYHEHFKSITSTLKSNYWFYHIKKTCDNFIPEDGLYLLKRYLNKAVKFEQKNNEEHEQQKEATSLDHIDQDLKREITEWIIRESYPVYGPVNSMSIDRLMGTGKTLVIAILEEYRPARKFLPSSNNFHQRFEVLAKWYTQHANYEKFLFAWSSDLELIESIAIGHVSVPNVMVLKPDYSYNLLIKDPKDLNAANESELSDKLKDSEVKMLLASAKLDRLTFEGGDSYLFRLMRHIFSQYNRFINMYRANPLLASLLIGLPSVIIIFVLYTTCCYDGPNLDEADEDDEEQALLNHVHQD